MTSIDPNDLLAASSARQQPLRIGSVERQDEIGRAEVTIVGGNGVRGDREAADGGGDGHGEERHHQELLPPFAAEHASRPPDDRPTRGHAAVPRSAER